jgi:MHS family alpha-ketoglutarate permease-like MFS transporter
MAPIILALARIVQGLSLGGEYGASATYLSEVADPKRRGFYSSFQYVTLIGGQLSALLVLIVLQKIFLTNDEIRAWGWRIPFVIGALLAIVAAIMRSQLQETPAFEEARKKVRTTSSLAALMSHPREVFLVIGLTLGGTAAFYTFTVYMQTFLKLSVGLDDDTTTLVAAGSLIFAMVLQPIYGFISDHIGRRPVLTWFGVCGVVFTYALLAGIQGTKNGFGALCLICFAWIIVAGYTSINAIVKAELFPTLVRATGVGVPYALTVSIFGGTAQAVALWFKSIGHETWFYWYLTGCIFISLLVYTSMRDTKLASAMERHE